MALVQGEDSESDEEINTDQLHALAVSPDGSLAGLSSLSAQLTKAHKSGIVMGEDLETDEEDEEDGSLEHTDGDGTGPKPGDRLSVLSHGGKAGSASPIGTPRKSSQDSTASVPQSLLHKKLRESNVSLRRSIVERILKLYNITSRNLTIVNDNLSKAQGIVEKVNTHLKRSDNELAKLNSIMEQVSVEHQTFALTIDIEVPASPKKSHSPLLLKLRQQQGRVPKVQLPNFLRNPSHDSSSGVDDRAPEARSPGRSVSTPPKQS